ncbi:MAG: hypothetical protein ACI4I4_07770 [Acutalibacteraceae bacterium]
MKKAIKLILLAISAAAVILLFASCGNKTVQVENFISMNAQFSGSRTVTLNMGELLDGNETLKAQFDEVVNEYCPAVMKKETKQTDDGLKYIFTIDFESEEDYENKISVIIGRQADSVLGTPNSALAKGWRFEEDFDGMQLFGFIVDGVKQKKYGELNFAYESSSNIVNLGGQIQSSNESIMSVNCVEGYPITSIAVETTNNKKDSYDRKFTISVPQTTYDKMGQSLLDIMQQRTADSAVYSGWSQQGNNQEFQVMYKGITAAQLQSVTALFLDCTEASIYYGDENNSSTPLAEQLVFEEKLNTLSFTAKDNGKVPLSYKYSLPLKTTHGEGIVFNKGVWEKEGSWVDGIYTLKSNRSNLAIRIPDGIQYKIEGIAVTVENNGEDNYTRSFNFLYDKGTGVEGCQYASAYFRKEGVETTTAKTNDNLVCRITKKGTAEELNEFFSGIFGGGNEITRAENTSAMAVVTDLSFKDSVNISYMLTGENEDVPFTYTLENKSGENIISITGENAKESVTERSQEKGKYTVELIGGENNVEFISTVPYFNGVLVYCIVAGVMLLLAALAIVFCIKRSRKLKQLEQEQESKTIEINQQVNAKRKSEEKQKYITDESGGYIYADNSSKNDEYGDSYADPYDSSYSEFDNDDLL